MENLTGLENKVTTLYDVMITLGPTDPGLKEAVVKLNAAIWERDAARAVVEDLNMARYLLGKHGYAFRIWGPEDIERRVRELTEHEGTSDHVAKIAEHIMTGDDWGTQSEETPEDDANLWVLIEGTRNDHPEWFGLDRD